MKRRWFRRHTFEIVMVLTVIAGIIVVAVTTRAQTTLARDPGSWIIQATGPKYDPVWIKSDRRVYLVDDDGGVRRCK